VRKGATRSRLRGAVRNGLGIVFDPVATGTCETGNGLV
jgi:hypothetical protein